LEKRLWCLNAEPVRKHARIKEVASWTSFENLTLIGNLDQSRVSILQVKRTVATLHERAQPALSVSDTVKSISCASSLLQSSFSKLCSADPVPRGSVDAFVYRLLWSMLFFLIKGIMFC